MDEKQKSARGLLVEIMEMQKTVSPELKAKRARLLKRLQESRSSATPPGSSTPEEPSGETS